MIKKFIVRYSLIIIITLAAILRLWHLGSIPPSLTPDEAALGYNAYSIIHTGRDEHGKFLPIIFKSFGDYKPGLYVYLDVPFVATLGLNEFSTRLPSALFGVLSVFLIYLIMNKLFGNKFGSISVFVAATNPYLIYFSRGAWEANISLALTLAGIYFFLKSLKANYNILYSSAFFALTLLTYQGAKLSTAIVVTLLLIVYWKDFWKIDKKLLITSGLAGLIVSLPIILSLFNGQAGRLKVFSIFSYRRPAEEVQKYYDNSYYFFHSEALNYVRAIGGRWFNNFSGKYLFFDGDTQNPVNTAPYQGVLLLCDLLFLPIGVVFMLRSKLNKSVVFVISWLLLAPLSSSISRDTTNAVRSLNVAVSMIMIISFGVYSILERLRIKGYMVVFSIWVLAFIYFLDAYFIHVPAHNSEFWRYGNKDAVNYILENGNKYDRVIFQQSYNQPYIYYLFYSKKILRANVTIGDNVYDVGLVEKIDNIEFKEIDWNDLKRSPRTLVVAASSPVEIPILKQIKYLNGRDVAFNIVEIK